MQFVGIFFSVDVTPPAKEVSHDCTIDITPPSKDVSPVAPHPRSSFIPSPVSHTPVCKKEYPSPVTPEEETLSTSPKSYILQRSNSKSRGSSPDRSSSGVGSEISVHSQSHIVAAGPPAGIARRLARSDRMDTKRYYTAGVIEDIKVKPFLSPRTIPSHLELSRSNLVCDTNIS